MENRIFLLSLGTLMFVFLGCASKNPPLQDISDAKMAILDAKDAGAKTLAADMFKNAEQKYQNMQKLMQEEKYIDAKYAAQKAYIQAKLANTLSKNVKTQQEVDELMSEIRVIKKDFAILSKDEK